MYNIWLTVNFFGFKPRINVRTISLALDFIVDSLSLQFNQIPKNYTILFSFSSCIHSLPKKIVLSFLSSLAFIVMSLVFFLLICISFRLKNSSAILIIFSICALLDATHVVSSAKATTACFYFFSFWSIGSKLLLYEVCNV